MADHPKAKGRLYQDEAAFQIKKNFGKAFVYRNENGNDAISKDVLKEFGS